jgi:hypothetical protein
MIFLICAHLRKSAAHKLPETKLHAGSPHRVIPLQDFGPAGDPTDAALQTTVDFQLYVPLAVLGIEPGRASVNRGLEAGVLFESLPDPDVRLLDRFENILPQFGF